MKSSCIIILLSSIIFSAGCVDIGDVFGADALVVKENKVTSGETNIITIKSVTTLPNPPLLPDQDLSLLFVLVNNDKQKAAERVMLNLFNAPTFKSQSGQFCNTVGCYPDPDECSVKNECTILPGEEKPINFYLKSPSEAEIAGIKTTTNLDYLLNYDYDATLIYTLPVVDKNEIVKRQQTNEKTQVTVSKSYSSGPVQIDVELLGAQYVLVDQDAVLMFKITNKGSGSIKNSMIKAASNENFEGMVVRFPKGIELPDYRPENKERTEKTSLFSCDGDVSSGWVCWNNKDIQIFKDESRVSIRFKIRVSSTELGGVPFSSYTIISSANYTYELRNTVSITVNTFHNV